jgi:hypothetical protein
MIRRKRLYARSASPRSTVTVIARAPSGAANGEIDARANAPANGDDDDDEDGGVIDRAPLVLETEVEARAHGTALASARAAVRPSRSNITRGRLREASARGGQ